MTETLDSLIVGRRTIICVGPGGVGKTTVAASIALGEAGAGRRACVVTIDPARRLADALGLDELGNEPHKVAASWLGRGELWAMMLDTKTTFDDVVSAQAADAEQREEILANRFYRNISGVLSGTQEYMAMEKLYSLHNDGRFDVVIIDTPPTSHALDFLDAPARLTRFLSNRFFRIVTAPTRAGFRAVSVATQLLLRTISRVVGSDVVHDAIAFFAAFEGMEQGFRDRAQSMAKLLAEEATAFIVVTAPRRDAVDEARYLAERLVARKIRVTALVINRVLGSFGEVPPAAVPSGPLQDLMANLVDLDGIARSEEHHIAAATAALSGTPVLRVPLLVDEVHDLIGLDIVTKALFQGLDARDPAGADPGT